MLWKAVVSRPYSPSPSPDIVISSVAVAGSAIKWLRDGMELIKSTSEVNTLATSVPDTGGVYFVTAFSGLLAPYWDPSAGGLLIGTLGTWLLFTKYPGLNHLPGLSSYTTPGHIARATLEANAFQTRAILESMHKDSKHEETAKALKVDGGMTNGDAAMQILADIIGMDIERPEMRE